MNIRIIITGGTIDKIYDPKDQRFEFRKTHIKSMLKEGRYLENVVIDKLMLKDSLSMTDKDRLKILYECKRSMQSKIVITHGTDTMTKTAKVLGKNMKNKTVILTGAMEPASLDKTDALFNLGGAIIAVQQLKHGVYIVMNGRVFLWNNVKKDYKTSIFEKSNRKKL